MTSTKRSNSSLFRYLLGHIKSFKFTLWVVFFAAIIDALVPSGLSYLTKLIIDQVQSASSSSLLAQVLPAVLFSIFLHILLEVMWRMYSYFFDFQCVPQLRRNIISENLEEILGKSYAFYQANHAGDITHSLIRLSKTIPLIINYVTQFLSLFTMILVGLFLLYQVHIGFAALILGWILLLLLLVYFSNQTIVEYSKKLSEKEMQIYGQVSDTLTGILSIKLFARKSHEEKIVNDTVSHAVAAERKVAKTYFLIYLCLSITYVIFQSLSLLLLIYERQLDRVTAGDFALVLGLNNTITMMMWYRVRSFAEFAQTLGESKQALQVIKTPFHIRDKPNAGRLKVQEGKIEFQNIFFRYPNTDQPIFEDFSLAIPPKEKVGIVGYSGGGKSSLIQLFLRLHDLDQGKILIDGQNIAEVTQESLRMQIGMVPQNPVLFHRNILENIRYGDMDARKDQVVAAAQKAHAHDFIGKMEHGYTSEVGEGGAKISGGQRQRIAMARVILKDAPILIFDEATSQLDSVTESLIQDSLDRVMKGKTAIVIAHRLSTLAKMDRIIVLDQGKIIEEGNHQDLLSKKGLYHQLWSTQVNGFLGDKANI